MAKRLHRTTPATENHVIQSWEVASSTERLALVPGPTDLGRVARQADDGSLWACTGYAPVTWRRFDPDPAEFSGPAQAAQAAAEAAAAAAVGSTKIYASTAAAQADGALANGSYYSVPVSGSNDSFIFYRKDSGAGSTEMTRYPSAALVATLQRNADSVLRLDFRSGFGAVTGLRAKGREAVTVVRSTTEEAWANGSRVSCGANTARVSDDPVGLLVEGTRTQYVTNPTAPADEDVTLATTGGGIHSVQVEGTGSVTVTAVGGTATGLPLTVTGRTPGTFTVTAGGTFHLAYTGTVTFAQVERMPFPTSRMLATGAHAADVVSVANPLVGRSGAWEIDCVVEVRGRSFGASDYKTIWVLGSTPYAGANVAVLVAQGESVYLDVRNGSNVQKRITAGTGINMAGSQTHRFTAGCDEAGNLYLLVDGEATNYSVAGAGDGIITVQPATIYLGGDGASATNWINGVIRDFKVRGSYREEDIVPARPRYLIAGDSIYMNAGLRSAIAAELWPQAVPEFDPYAIGGDHIGTALMVMADKHYMFSGGTYYPNGRWMEMSRQRKLAEYDALILEYGRNEPGMTGMSWTVYQEAYDKIVHNALKQGIRRVIPGNPPPLAAADLLSWAGSDAYTSQYRTVVSDLCTRLGLRFCDTYGTFLDLVTRGQKSIADLMSDTGHANTTAGLADMARRIAIGLKERQRVINRKTAAFGQVTPVVGGTVRTYFMASQVAGTWTREFLDTETHRGLNANSAWAQYLPRLAGVREQALRGSQVGDRIIWSVASGLPSGRARQIWLHMVLETGGGSFNTYVDRGTGGEVLRSHSTNGGERIYSVLMGENLAAGADHTAEVQLTGAGGVSILGVTYMGND